MLIVNNVGNNSIAGKPEGSAEELRDHNYCQRSYHESQIIRSVNIWQVLNLMIQLVFAIVYSARLQFFSDESFCFEFYG